MSRGGNTSPSRRSGWNLQNQIDHGDTVHSSRGSKGSISSRLSSSSLQPTPTKGTVSHSNYHYNKNPSLRRTSSTGGTGTSSRKRQKWLTSGESGNYYYRDLRFIKICKKTLLSKCVPVFVCIVWLYIVLSTTTLMHKASSSTKQKQESPEDFSSSLPPTFGYNAKPHHLRDPNKGGRKSQANSIPELASYQELTRATRSATSNNQTVVIVPIKSNMDTAYVIRQLKFLQSNEMVVPVLGVSSDVQKRYLQQHKNACHLSSVIIPSSEDWQRILFQSCFLYQHGGLFVNLEQVQFLSSLNSTISALSQPMTHVALVENENFGLYQHIMFSSKSGSELLKSVLKTLNLHDEYFSSNKIDSTTLYSRFISDASKDFYSSVKHGHQKNLILRHRCFPTCDYELSVYCCQVSLDTHDWSRYLFATKGFQSVKEATSMDLKIDSVSGGNKAIDEHTAAGASTTTTVIVPEIHEKQISFPQSTPNFYHIMSSGECLPSNRHCRKCLANEGRCTIRCKKLCPCYCAALCHTDIQEKFLSHSFYVVPPKTEEKTNLKTGLSVSWQQDTAIIPKIIHQIWIEPESKIFGDNPHKEMSRIINTWKISGWDHRLYHLDEDIPKFLKEHFPPQILEAYESVVPTRFKSDFARLCLLLIHGGIYADPDVLLNTNLENAIPHDVGFLAAVDFVNPKDKERRDIPSPCLSNELLVSAPGHPFLAKALEYIVNGIRNRFTSVDYDDLQCPTPMLNLTYYYANHYTTGSCALGSAVNDVLGRPRSSVFEVGTIIDTVNHDDTNILLPGKTIILHSKHKDMGTLRFTLKDENILLANRMKRAITDWPNTYQYTSVPSGNELQHVYGSKSVYKDKISANENIRFVLGPPHTYQSSL